MRRLAWFETRDHQRRKRPWRWVFVDQMPPGHEKAGGLTILKTREVLILCTLGTRRIAEIVGHELIHVMCGHEPRESPLDRESEEQTAVLAEPSLVPLMASLGARLPPFPDGFDAFRKAARKAK